MLITLHNAWSMLNYGHRKVVESSLPFKPMLGIALQRKFGMVMYFDHLLDCFDFDYTLWIIQSLQWTWACMAWKWFYISRVSCQKGPTRHAYACQIGPFWQDTLDLTSENERYNMVSYLTFPSWDIETLLSRVTNVSYITQWRIS